MTMNRPGIAPRAEWLAARKALLAKEKDFTRRRDALNAERRRLPMVRVDKDYVFGGPHGPARLLDLFDFLRDGGTIFQTYSAYARGTDLLVGTYNYLDMTALGRQEDWEEPRGRSDGPFMAWLRRHDEYDGIIVSPSGEAAVREVIADWAAAVRAKDVDRVVAHYAADVVSFDLAPPLKYAGREALRKSLSEWFRTFQGPVGYDVHDLSITGSHDVAFCRSLNRITGARTKGEKTDVWVRTTIGCRRAGDTWLIAHEHASVPFYMDGSDRAAIDLKPE
jgi:uncharacterized protein (TIGR02246 family)